MKKIMFGLAFLLAIISAFATFASSPKVLETAYIRNPDIAHCTATSTQCDITATNPCLISGKQGYRIGCTTMLFKF